jgi:hypothetical protein
MLIGNPLAGTPLGTDHNENREYMESLPSWDV